MSVKNYRFVSPGVFVNEIDNSQLPASPAGIGPVIIGRAEKGPALRPTTVNSFEEFVNIFGTPNPGRSGDDVWRQGANTTATTYGMYAAQAYLRNSSPLTYIRLLGAESDNATVAGEAGWDAGASGVAWGLVLFQTGAANTVLTGALGAIVYAQSGVELQLSGNILRNTGTTYESSVALTGSDVVVLSANNDAKEFKTIIRDGSTTVDTITTNFNRGDSSYIRKALNTNPQLLNTAITDGDNQEKYFLGETFDRHLDAVLSDADSAIAGAWIRLTDGSTEGDDFRYDAQAAETPQIISCKLSPGSTPTSLFKFVARGEAGDWTSKNLKVSIQDIKRSTNEENQYGTFSVVVRHLSDSDNVVRVVEQFNNCDLNPNSLNYVARKIGDSYDEWNQTERRYVRKGNYPNNSQYLYIDVNSDVDAGVTNPSLLPFGFEGIIKYKDLSSQTGADRSVSWLSGSFTDVPATSGGAYTTGGVFIVSGSTTTDVTSSVTFPEPVLRISASAGNLQNPTDAYFGLQTSRGVGSTVFASSTIDLLRPSRRCSRFRSGNRGRAFSNIHARRCFWIWCMGYRLLY